MKAWKQQQVMFTRLHPSPHYASTIHVQIGRVYLYLPGMHMCLATKLLMCYVILHVITTRHYIYIYIIYTSTVNDIAMRSVRK